MWSIIVWSAALFSKGMRMCSYMAVRGKRRDYGVGKPRKPYNGFRTVFGTKVSRSSLTLSTMMTVATGPPGFCRSRFDIQNANLPFPQIEEVVGI